MRHLEFANPGGKPLPAVLRMTIEESAGSIPVGIPIEIRTERVCKGLQARERVSVAAPPLPLREIEILHCPEIS